MLHIGFHSCSLTRSKKNYLKRSRLLARALAFALVRFREHYDMLSNPLSICKSGWQSKMIPNPWVIRDDSGWSLVVPNDVLDWNSLCSTSHLCNDLIYTLVDSTGLEIQVQWDGNGRDVQGLSMSLTKTMMGIRVSNLLEFFTSQDHKPISQDLLLWPPDASDIFPHCPSFPAPKAENQWPNSVAKFK